MTLPRHTTGPVVLVVKRPSYAFPAGIGYLAGYLKERGEDVRVLFRPEEQAQYAAFAQRVHLLRPLLVGFGSLYPDLYAVQRLVERLNEQERAFPVVIGGQMVSPTPEFALEVTQAEVGVLGEGEIVLHELVTALRERRDVSRVKGLALRHGSEVTLTGAGEFIRDLTQLPDIPYELFPSELWLHVGRGYVGLAQPHWRYNDRVVSVHGGRGCPHRCNFCYHHSVARYRPVPDIVAEADDLVARFGANVVYFGDDLVLASPGRARALTESIGSLGRRIEYSVSTKFDILSRIDDELLTEMKRTGCRIMGLGVESGSQRMLDAMHKGITVEQVVTGLQRLKRVGILPTVSIMVGQLGETLEDVEESLKLMVETVRFDKNIEYAFTITTPFPGTELYETALRTGALRDHRDFFDRFDALRQTCSLTVNLSAMADHEVVTSLARLNAAFRTEKTAAIGQSAALVETGRKWTARADRAFRRRLGRRLPRKCRRGGLAKAYSFLYDGTQTALDGLRLQLLGVNDCRAPAPQPSASL